MSKNSRDLKIIVTSQLLADNEWFNSASVSDIVENKDAVSAALCGTGENMNYFLFL